MKITKSQLKEIIREEIYKLNDARNIKESSYKFGKVEYTRNKLTPTQILDLANAYLNTPITKLAGRDHGSRVVVANDISNLNGRIQHRPNETSKSPALIHQVLKSGLITTDEYKTLYRSLIDRHKQFVGKYLNNSDYSRRFDAAGNDSVSVQAKNDMGSYFDFQF